MSDIVITDKRSINELSKLIDFCSLLIIKDEDEASKYETTKSMQEGYQFINAMLRADNFEDHTITKSDLESLDTDSKKYSIYNPDNLPPEILEEVLELKRYQIYKKYLKSGDSNSYYKNIYDTYFKKTDKEMTFEEFKVNGNLPFYVAARLYKQFSLLYTPSGILNSNEVIKFKNCYSACQNYFLKVCYNDAYKVGNPKYNSLCMLIIVFMSIKRYLSTRLENIDDIDFFDEYSIRNMFLSYGLDYFFDMPLKYQRRILKNLNYLIKNKGTDKAIINILELFGFKNIKVMKYILCKEYPKDENGKLMLSEPELNFYGLDTEIPKFEDALNKSEKEDYEKFTKNDKYWQIDKYGPDGTTFSEDYSKLLAEPFNYIYTKYISVEGMMDLSNASVEFTYFLNYLYSIKEKFREDPTFVNKLYFYNYNISDREIDLIHASFLLTALVFKKFGYKDNIVKNVSSLTKIMDFNFKEPKEDLCFYKEQIARYKVNLNDYLDYIPVKDNKPMSDEELFNQQIIVDIEYGYDDKGKALIKKELDIINSEVIEYKLCYLERKAVSNYKKQNLISFEQVEKEFSKSTLINQFKTNNTFRKNLEEAILKTNNRRLYRQYMVLHRACFVNEFRNDVFTTYTTYTEYFKAKDPDLYNFIKKIEQKCEEENANKEEIYNEYILELCNSIDSYLDDDDLNYFIQGNVYLVDYIKEFVYQMIEFIRSYTIHVKQISTIYIFDERFMNTMKFFDELEWNHILSQTDLVPFEDRVSPNNTEILTPEDLFKYVEECAYLTSVMKESDDLELQELLKTFNIDTLTTLLKFNDREEINMLVKYIDEFYTYDGNFSLSTNYEFKDKNYLKSLLISLNAFAISNDLLSQNDEVTNNDTSIIDIVELKINDNIKNVDNHFSVKSKIRTNDKMNSINYLQLHEVRLIDKMREDIHIINSYSNVEQFNMKEELYGQDFVIENILLFRDVLNQVLLYEDLKIVKFDLSRLISNKVYIKRQDEIFTLSALGTIEYYMTEGSSEKRRDFIYNNGILIISKKHGDISYVAMSNTETEFELLNIGKGDLNNE